MFYSPEVVPGVVIPVSSTPLYVGQEYIIHVGNQDFIGCIRSMRGMLNGSFSRYSPNMRLHSGQLVSVNIEFIPISSATRIYEQRMLEFMIKLPSTHEIIGNGLLISALASQKGDNGSVKTQNGLTVWFTGFSGAGKTTIARRVQQRLEPYCRVELLDGDIVRSFLSRDLGYSRADRNENVYRLGFLADLLTQAGVVVLVAAISPYRAVRDKIRDAIGQFVEVYVNTPISICEQRDVKGLYRKARAGEISGFTGIDDPYEPPLSPEVECNTDVESVESCLSKVICAIRRKVNVELCSSNAARQRIH